MRDDTIKHCECQEEIVDRTDMDVHYTECVCGQGLVAKVKRSGIDIETELKSIMSEYLDYCNKSNCISFQGGISEMAWEVEFDQEDDRELNTYAFPSTHKR